MYLPTCTPATAAHETDRSHHLTSSPNLGLVGKGQPTPSPQSHMAPATVPHAPSLQAEQDAPSSTDRTEARCQSADTARVRPAYLYTRFTIQRSQANQVGVGSQYKNKYFMQHAQETELCGEREFVQCGHTAGHKSNQERFPQEIDLG